MNQGLDKQVNERIPEAGKEVNIVVDFEGDKYTLQVERMSEFFERGTGNPRLWVKYSTSVIASGVELRNGKWICDSPWVQSDGSEVHEDHDWGTTIEEVAHNAFLRWVKSSNVGSIKLDCRNGAGLLRNLKELRRNVERHVTDLVSKASEMEVGEECPLGETIRNDLVYELIAIREALAKLPF